MTTHSNARISAQNSARNRARGSRQDGVQASPAGATPGGGADPRVAAVAALTEVARRAQPDRDGRRWGSDPAAVIAAVVASVAANVGGLEVLLAGRSGSWEAEAVRRLVHGTVGEDEVGLWWFRTEPVRLVLDVEDEFSRF